MRALLFIFLSITLLQASIQLNQEEQDYIQNNPSVTIGLTSDRPFTFREENETKGLTKDILDEISKLTKLRFNIKQNSWIENFEDFENGKIDIISDFFYKRERKNIAIYSAPYIKVPLVVFANKPYADFESFKNFDSIKVGVVKESSVIESLKSFPNIAIVEFENQNDQISALSFEKIDFAVQTLHTTNVYIKRNFFTNIYPLKSYEDARYYEALHFGINKQKPLLQSIINKALKNINLNSLKEKWFNLSEENSKIALSEKEKVFLEKYPIITLGTEKSWEPYVIQNADGSINGYDVDVLRKINQLTGANFQLRLGDWQELQKKAQKKEIDGLSTGAIHDERKSYLNFSDIYISLQKMVIVKHRNPLNIKSKKDLEGKTIVIHKGNLVDEKIVKEFPKSTIIRVDTVEQMLEEVIYGEADATFGNGATEYIANKLGLPYLDFAFPLDHRLELAFGIRKDWPEAISVINKALKAIPEHEKIRIKEKWFVLSDFEKQHEERKSKVTLSADEKLYLKNNPSVKLCIDPHWYPFEFLNKEGKYDGLIAELLYTISSNIGISTNLVKTENWSQSLGFLQDGKCDIAASVQKTAKREEYLNFTSPYVTTPLVLATKSSINFIDNFQKISNQSFAIVKGYASIDLLKEKYEDIKIIEVDSIDAGLEHVLNGKVFGFIDTVPTILYTMKQSGYTNLSINGKVDLNWSLRIGTTVNKPMLNSIFEKGVKSLNEKEIEEVYNNWINAPDIKEPDYTVFWQLLGGLLLVVVVVLVWNRQLKQQIEKALQKHKEQESLLFYYAKQKSMGELMGNISHQWRHPLSELSGNIFNIETKQALGKNISAEDLKAHIGSSKDIINFMSETVETFYNFYKDGRQNVEFNINDLIEETLLISKGSFSHNKIAITKIIEKDLSIHGNPSELKQVLLAILVNAKSVFEQRNIQNPKIKISAQKLDDSSCFVEIEDNGGGIDDGIINQIFDVHFSSVGSSGMGLYISKKIIEEKFDGVLHVENGTEGARFSLTLPLKR